MTGIFSIWHPWHPWHSFMTCPRCQAAHSAQPEGSTSSVGSMDVIHHHPQKIEILEISSSPKRNCFLHLSGCYDNTFLGICKDRSEEVSVGTSRNGDTSWSFFWRHHMRDAPEHDSTLLYNSVVGNGTSPISWCPFDLMFEFPMARNAQMNLTGLNSCFNMFHQVSVPWWFIWWIVQSWPRWPCEAKLFNGAGRPAEPNRSVSPWSRKGGGN